MPLKEEDEPVSLAQAPGNGAAPPDGEGDGRPDEGRNLREPLGATGQGQGGLAVLRVLRHREFAVFWGGQAISLVGSWMQTYAQGWVVANLSASAFALGLVTFATSLPALLLMPFGGVTADRIERRRILIYTQWMMLLLAVAMGVL